MCSKFFKSGDDRYPYYRITEDGDYKYVSKLTNITFFGNREYHEALGRARSMSDAIALIQARSGYKKVAQT